MVFTSLAVILRIFSNPVANLFEKRVSTNSSSLFTSFYSYLIMGLCCIPFSLNYNWSLLPQKFWIYTLVAGLLCATGRACMIKALQLGELSVLGPINSYKSIVGMVLAIILLSEFPSLYGILGVILIIYGSRFIFDTLDEGFSFKLFKRKDILLRIVALILTGTEAVILKKIILLSNVSVCFIMWAWTGCFFTFALICITKTEFHPVKMSQIQQYFIISLSLAIMQLSTNYVFLHMKVGYALALFQLSSIVNLIFGIKFFREKDLFRKIIGTIIMIVGSTIIILCP